MTQRAESESSPSHGLVQTLLRGALRPVARRLLYSTLTPDARNRWLFSALFQMDFVGREVFEWGRRSLVATPVFLSQCARHGQNIAVERLPYMTGPCRIELGNEIRFGGQINILPASGGTPLLRIEDGVFVGHQTTFAVAKRIEIGRFASIGEGCYLADTEGHAHYNPNRPIWEVPASPDDIADVVIEDNVQIGRDCQILKGVRIGARAIVGAGSVVRTNIPPDAVVMGNPARVAKRIKPAEPVTEPKEREG